MQTNPAYGGTGGKSNSYTRELIAVDFTISNLRRCSLVPPPLQRYQSPRSRSWDSNRWTLFSCSILPFSATVAFEVPSTGPRNPFSRFLSDRCPTSDPASRSFLTGAILSFPSPLSPSSRLPLAFPSPSPRRSFRFTLCQLTDSSGFFALAGSLAGRLSFSADKKWRANNKEGITSLRHIRRFIFLPVLFPRFATTPSRGHHPAHPFLPLSAENAATSTVESF